MRQALNNLQSTKEGFGLVKAENVFKVCDEPHPLMIKDMLTHCNKGSLEDAYKIMLQVQGTSHFKYHDWNSWSYIFPKALVATNKKAHKTDPIFW